MGFTVIAGVGFTIMTEVMVVPVHPTALLVKVGVAVTVPVIGAVPPLLGVNDNILPVPELAKPIAMLLFVHG